MSTVVPVGASVAIIVLGILTAWSTRRREPVFSVPQPVTALTPGVALGGPFVLRRLGLLPVPEASGWELITAPAVSVTLWLAAVQPIGLDDGSSGTDTAC